MSCNDHSVSSPVEVDANPDEVDLSHFLLQHVLGSGGGDLRYNLGISGHRFSEERAKFYICQVIIALEYCHKLRILHRDIKPENILLNDDGYIKLTDFGVSKMMDAHGECHSTSGTHGYMAPELYVAPLYTHGTAADWFAMGVTLHEFLVGCRPFDSKRIRSCQKSPLNMPLKHLDLAPASTDCKSFISKLLCSQAYRRLRGKDCPGASALNLMKSHPWLKDVDWLKMSLKQIAPPMVPNVDLARCCMSNADAGEVLREHLSVPPPADEDQHKFIHYAYKNKLRVVQVPSPSVSPADQADASADCTTTASLLPTSQHEGDRSTESPWCSPASLKSPDSASVSGLVSGSCERTTHQSGTHPSGTSSPLFPAPSAGRDYGSVAAGKPVPGSLTIDATRHQFLGQSSNLVRSFRIVCDLQRLDENDHSGSGSGSDDASVSVSACASASRSPDESFTCPSSVSVLSEGVGTMGMGVAVGYGTRRGVDGASTMSISGTPSPHIGVSFPSTGHASLSPAPLMPSVTTVHSVLFPQSGVIDGLGMHVQDAVQIVVGEDQGAVSQSDSQRKRKLITCTPRLPSDTSPLPAHSLLHKTHEDLRHRGGEPRNHLSRLSAEGRGNEGVEESKEASPSVSDTPHESDKVREARWLNHLIGDPMW